MIERSERGLCLFNKVGNNLKISKGSSQVGYIKQLKSKIKVQVKKRNRFQHL